MIVKKKVIILLGIVAILVMGGMGMFNSFTGKDEPRYKHEQDRMVEYLVKNYKNIEKVEFTRGTWSSNAIINDKVYVTFNVNSLGASEEIGFGQHVSQSDGNRLIKREISSKKNRKSVEVIYYRKDK
ncbi:TPA: DUF1433 domain-containing protein [Streptococcus equi subsp. zooepidemicus]|nr:DUF1433 domain-containing protein [Streptococcus equi subsp. zooepidemicus]HEL0170753.1 DUF1433 domain-containing protein [Streptococcus equi subsp. zooepidemicus]HEL0186785.1 DUF1433 domain-containing protein [Streptococcus equi subsp. zooepidemicus]HEL0192704.1 DUF1433 domain-containing protein [Streptococcus equi subsp. zooepidemicus]HEL0234905.1 DUF1433 domain-containing protein [Streptococcus equi subsp. zooepidemicus]